MFYGFIDGEVIPRAMRKGVDRVATVRGSTFHDQLSCDRRELNTGAIVSSRDQDPFHTWDSSDKGRPSIVPGLSPDQDLAMGN